jgi:hypothetical protein
VKTITSGRVALVLSGLALLIALGGTAYAVNTVRSSDIVDGTIQSRDIGTAQVQGVDIKQNTITTADVAPAGLGRSPRLFAVVNAELNLVASAGVTHYENGGGFPSITFNRSVQNCAIAATVRSPDGKFFATATVDGLVNKKVDVFVYRHDGNVVQSAVDVVVVC